MTSEEIVQALRCCAKGLGGQEEWLTNISGARKPRNTSRKWRLRSEFQ